jgi:predicted ATPase
MEQKASIPIRTLHVENFGCVRDATVELEPLTVLVGPNDSGKSMLLKTLPTLAAAAATEEGWRALFPTPAALSALTFNGNGDPIRIGLRGALGEVDYRYDVEIGTGTYGIGVRSEHLNLGSADAKRTEKGIVFRASSDAAEKGPYTFAGINTPMLNWPWFTPSNPTEEFKRFTTIFQPAQKLISLLFGSSAYSLRPEDLRRPYLHEIAPTPEERPSRLGPHGEGLANAIADLLLRGRDTLERIEASLARAMPQVKRIDIRQRRAEAGGAPTNELELVIRSGMRVPAGFISDGVLLYLGYLYLVLGPNPAPVLLVEEPETGLHFARLRSLMKLFRDMTAGAHGGPPTQVILTTHSPMLLNLVEPQEIRVVQRGDDGATTVTPFTNAPDLEALLDYQGPGEIWVNEGEEYIVRGKARS